MILLFVILVIQLVSNIGYNYFRSKIFGKAKGDKSLYDLLLKRTSPISILCILIPLATIEEVIFRYLLVGQAHAFFGHLASFIVLSAILFALAHWSNAKGATLIQHWSIMPIQIWSALIFTYIFLNYGLIIAILIHTAYNFIVVNIALIKYERHPEKLAQDFDLT